jgi:hypothetical protein
LNNNSRKAFQQNATSEDELTAKSFDEILAPIRKSFQESGMSEDELDSLFEEAREEVYQTRIMKETP